MSECWTTVDDMNMDLLLLSDFRTVPEPKEPSKPSTHQQMARARPSLFEDPFDVEGDERPLPIRGHPIFRNNLESMPPGGTPSFLLQQNETSKEIRQVSGIGYSNDLIEHTLRGDTVKTQPMPNIELNHSSSSSNSSRTASPSPSPQHSAKHKHNGVYKLSTKPLQRTMNHTSNTLNGAEHNNAGAPPLFDLLNSTPKKNEEKTAYRHMFGLKENKPLDINSKLEFPDLS